MEHKGKIEEHGKIVERENIEHKGKIQEHGKIVERENMEHEGKIKEHGHYNYIISTVYWPYALKTSCKWVNMRLALSWHSNPTTSYTLTEGLLGLITPYILLLF